MAAAFQRGSRSTVRRIVRNFIASLVKILAVGWFRSGSAESAFPNPFDNKRPLQSSKLLEIVIRIIELCVLVVVGVM